MKRNWILVVLLPAMLFVLYMAFVKLPEMKCDRLASDLQATSYVFSPVNGCYILQSDGTWLVSPNYPQQYRSEP